MTLRGTIGLPPRLASNSLSTDNHGRDDMRLIQGLLATIMLAALAACNTVGGMGQDLQSGGAAITDTAEDTEAQM